MFNDKIESKDFWYPKALDMFGHAVSARSERYVYWGIKRRTNDQAREESIQEVNPLIINMGLQVPDPAKGEDIFLGAKRLHMVKRLLARSRIEDDRGWGNKSKIRSNSSIRGY